MSDRNKMATELTKKEYMKLRGDLLLIGVTFADVGREFGVSREYVTQAVRGKWNSDTAVKIREHVKEKIAASEGQASE